MLPSRNRIPRKVFPLLSNKAKTFRNNIFSLRYVPNTKPGSRFSFSVSKKVAKNAVARNKLRRTGYRLLKKYLPRIKTDILASFSFRTMPKSDDEIIKNLESILNDSLL